MKGNIFRISEGKSNKKFILAGHRKTHYPEKESDWLIFYFKIVQTIKKAATKVVRANIKSFMEELFSEN